MDTVAIIAAAALAALLAARELTWRRAVARMRRQAAADGIQLREQEQLAQVGQLVSGLAQELKNPLRGVIGNAELMLAGGGSGGDAKDDSSSSAPANGGYRFHLELPVTAGRADHPHALAT